MTPFKTTLVPPPMCAFSLNFPLSVTQVFFTPSSHGNDVMCLLSDNTLRLFTFDESASCKEDASVAVKVDACGGSGFNTKCTLPRYSSSFK